MRHLEGILTNIWKSSWIKMGPKRANGPPRGRIYDAGYQTVYIGCTALKRELHFGPKMLQTYYVFNGFMIWSSNGQDPETKKNMFPYFFAFAKVSVWLESGVNFKKRAKTRFQKCARRLGESATTKGAVPRLTRRWGESSVFNIYVAKVYENTIRNEHRSLSPQQQ